MRRTSDWGFERRRVLVFGVTREEGAGDTSTWVMGHVLDSDEYYQSLCDE